MSLLPRIRRRAFGLVIESSGDAVSSDAVEFNGLLRGVLVNAPDLDDTDTFTVTVTDADGFDLFSKGSLAENTKHQLLVDANDMALAVPLSGNHTVTLTASGDQAADRTFSVVLLVEE